MGRELGGLAFDCHVPQPGPHRAAAGQADHAILRFGGRDGVEQADPARARVGPQPGGELAGEAFRAAGGHVGATAAAPADPAAQSRDDRDPAWQVEEDDEVGAV